MLRESYLPALQMFTSFFFVEHWLLWPVIRDIYVAAALLAEPCRPGTYHEEKWEYSMAFLDRAENRGGYDISFILVGST